MPREDTQPSKQCIFTQELAGIVVYSYGGDNEDDEEIPKMDNFRGMIEMSYTCVSFNSIHKKVVT